MELKASGGTTVWRFAAGDVGVKDAGVKDVGVRENLSNSSLVTPRPDKEKSAMIMEAFLFYARASLLQKRGSEYHQQIC